MLEGETVMINEATIVLTDIEGSSGVILVIDAVLPPAADVTAMGEEDMSGDEMSEKIDQAASDENFYTLVTALEQAGLDAALQGEGLFTVLVPTNDAFNVLPESAQESLVDDMDALTDLLLYHVVEGEAMAADVIEMEGQKV